MPAPARTLRAITDELPQSRRFLTQRELDRHALILAAGRATMARLGRAEVTLPRLATALRMSTGTIQRHVCDADSLLAEILFDHLRALATALGDTVRNGVHCQNAKRAAYVAATRTPNGGLTEAHLLLVRDRHTLPPDLAEQVNGLRDDLAEAMAGSLADVVLIILDSISLSLAEMEEGLAGIARKRYGEMAPHSEPAQQVKPARHLRPMRPAAPMRPAEPTLSTEPAPPAKPPWPAETARLVEPAYPARPAGPVHVATIQPVGPARTDVTVRSVETAHAIAAVLPVGAAQPHDPARPTALVQPSRAALRLMALCSPAPPEHIRLPKPPQRHRTAHRATAGPNVKATRT